MFDSMSVELLKRELGIEEKPTLDTLTKVKNEYRATLERARTGAVNPETWYWEWRSAYLSAEVYGIPDVTGKLPVKEFIYAVGARMFPGWAFNALYEWIKNDTLGRPTLTLDETGIVFKGWIDETSTWQRHDAYRTETPTERVRDSSPRYDNPERPGKSSRPAEPRSTSTGNACPCEKIAGKAHPWPPEECGILQYAVVGYCDRQTPKLSDKKCKEIRTWYETARWRYLRAWIELYGWSVKPTTASSKKNKNKSKPAKPGLIAWSGNMA
ncbi:hypothetical protein F4820DRAFT_434326 [Hypoxylon rubiginosum]|uniref:Uncharacterized protein n=1 Tax=Hypoxylon rubiginosum TaxID=110542 RepID=A0ACB9YQ62_9PEZI|nr:hypothetical protein F4820DRAFT_434326 [Hypoxylon rubiginosum]